MSTAITRARSTSVSARAGGAAMEANAASESARASRRSADLNIAVSSPGRECTITRNAAMWRFSQSAARLRHDREGGTVGAVRVERGRIEGDRVVGSAQGGGAARRVALVAAADLGEDAGVIGRLAALQKLVVAPPRPLLGGRRDEQLHIGVGAD